MNLPSVRKQFQQCQSNHINLLFNFKTHIYLHVSNLVNISKLQILTAGSKLSPLELHQRIISSFFHHL